MLRICLMRILLVHVATYISYVGSNIFRESLIMQILGTNCAIKDIWIHVFSLKKLIFHRKRLGNF